MSNALTLFHGSTRVIERPIFGLGNPRNDYGLGFYCSESIELAKEWATSEERDGYANHYELDLVGLSVLSLTSGDYNILNWLSILLENRTFRTNGSTAKAAKEYILDNFSVDYKGFDIIKGYRADDSYFSFASSFLNNAISLSQLERAMILGKLGEQVVLKSKKAFEAIRFVDAEIASKEIYYPKKLARDSKAREDFRKESSGVFHVGDKYIMDIIREGWKNDDQRLQRVVLR